MKKVNIQLITVIGFWFLGTILLFQNNIKNTTVITLSTLILIISIAFYYKKKKS